MQKQTIILGGLAPDYMRRLALYLQEQMETEVQIEISEQWELQRKRPESDSRMGVGSRAFIAYLEQYTGMEHLLTLTEDGREDEGHVFCYQSRDKLYRKIRRYGESRGLFFSGGRAEGKQDWYTVFSEGAVGELLAFSTVCAQVLSETRRVLYINLSGCSGMRELLSLEHEDSLEELFLALRKEPKTELSRYVVCQEGVDYLPSADNPIILYELDQQDMELFLQAVSDAKRYDAVVFAVGSVPCGCEKIFSFAKKNLHLMLPGMLNSSAGREWEDFVRRCTKQSEDKVVQILMPRMQAGEYGPHLPVLWADKEAGRVARQHLMPGKDSDRQDENE